jgi:hypothetical protein
MHEREGGIVAGGADIAEMIGEPFRARRNQTW